MDPKRIPSIRRLVKLKREAGADVGQIASSLGLQVAEVLEILQDRDHAPPPPRSVRL